MLMNIYTEDELRMKLANKENQIDELLIVIDTAQAALRRAESALEGEDKEHVINPSAKWVMNFKI
jgi:hypothetical protein